MTGFQIGARVSPLLALTFAATALLTAPVAAQDWAAIPPNPAIIVSDSSYIPPKSEQWQESYQRLKQRKVLEELQHFFAPLHLPHPLHLYAWQCDDVNAFYVTAWHPPGTSIPDARSLVLCYELFDALKNSAPPEATTISGVSITRQAATVGALVGILLHESGHMMFNMLDVPVFGREEDAADQTAAVMALQFNKELALNVLKGFAYIWKPGQFGSDPAGTDPITTWSDEHGKGSQRMYNTLCEAYGGDPKTFQEFVDGGWLPKQRAAFCAQEYAQLKMAYDKTILPFIDQALMERVKKAQWLTPEELGPK